MPCASKHELMATAPLAVLCVQVKQTHDAYFAQLIKMHDA